MASAVFRGLVELPSNMMVAEDALGHRFEVDLPGVKIAVTVPALPGADPPELFDLVHPDPDITRLVHDDGRAWGYGAFGITPGAPRILASWVKTVALDATVRDADDLDANSASSLGKTFDDWWSRVIAWLELWTPQHLNPDANGPVRTRGRVYDMRLGNPPPNSTGWSTGGRIIMHRSVAAAVSHAMLTEALARAATDEVPPLQWQMLCRARRLVDRRQALLDAAAAAEIALAETIHQRLANASVAAKERIVRDAQGIVGLLGLVEDLDAVDQSDSRRSRVADRLAGPRNDAAHQGVVPTQETLQRALREVQDTLEAYTPAPQPT